MEQRTLTERLERVEKILSYSGFGGEDWAPKEAARQYRDEQIRYEQMSIKDQDRAEELAQQKDIRFQWDWERRYYEGNARTNTTATVPTPTAFEGIADRIQTGTDRICMIAGKLEQIAIRILGPLPENPGEEAGAGVNMNPEGTLDTTHLALNWLDQGLCRLHNAAVRLELL